MLCHRATEYQRNASPETPADQTVISRVGFTFPSGVTNAMIPGTRRFRGSLRCPSGGLAQFHSGR